MRRWCSTLSGWRCGGEVMVTKMPVARIEDIAHIMRDKFSSHGEVEIVEIGAKPGEKMYEELMNDEEVRRTFEYGDFFIVLSAFADMNASHYSRFADLPRPDRPYNSAHEPALLRSELEDYLAERAILE